MEEQQIRDLHQKCKGILEEVINDFKYIKIPRSTKAEADKAAKHQSKQEHLGDSNNGH